MTSTVSIQSSDQFSYLSNYDVSFLIMLMGQRHQGRPIRCVMYFDVGSLYGYFLFPYVDIFGWLVEVGSQKTRMVGLRLYVNMQTPMVGLSLWPTNLICMHRISNVLDILGNSLSLGLQLWISCFRYFR